MGSFQADLERRAGSSLQDMNPTKESVQAWNRGIEQGHARAFDDRVLLGLAIEAGRPGHGDVRAYQAEVGERLGRKDRWVRETVQVAKSIRSAFEDGLELPSELRQLPWRLVPNAIENVRLGRGLDYRPKKEARPVTLRQIDKLVKQLVTELERMEDPEERQEGIRRALETLESIGQPEPLDPSGIVESPGEPDRPARRSRRRPGRGRR